MTNTRRVIALALLAGVFIMEGYDIAAMALAVPRLDAALGLPPSSFGWVFSALLIGLGAGGALLAPLGDRIGRRPLIVFGCLAVAVATLATATASGVTEFLVWRLLTGIGLGAALPNVSALSAELAPPRLRATIMAVVSAGIPLGLAIAGLLAPEVIAMGGWQALFIVPGLAAAAIAIALGYVLAAGPPEADPGPAAALGAKPSLPQFELFASPWLLPFAVFALMLSLNAMNLYYLNSWVPTVLPQAGFSQELADRISGVVQLAGIAVGVAVSLGVDRWRPGATLMIAFAIMAASFLAVGLTAPEATRWTLLLSIGIGGASAGGMALPALCAYLFPARLLSSAIGMGVLVARLGAIAGPPIGAAFIARDAGPQTFFAFAALPATLCVFAALLVPMALRVRGKVDAKAATA